MCLMSLSDDCELNKASDFVGEPHVNTRGLNYGDWIGEIGEETIGTGFRPSNDCKEHVALKETSRNDEENLSVAEGNDQKEQMNSRNESDKSVVSNYETVLPNFDDYATASIDSPGVSCMSVSKAVGYGFEVGDMVWGKVKSHPWWPGHIFCEEFATSAVRRARREGHVLAAFFGDNSYGWFHPAELIHFDPHYPEKSQQLASRNFTKAIEEAMYEVSKRSGLGLACRCRHPYNFRKTKVQGYFAVDVPDFDPPGIYSVIQIKKARDSFQPSATLSLIKQLAVAPQNCDQMSIDWFKTKATIQSYRKAVYEEFDETYAQAFGMQAVRPSKADGALDLHLKEPSRALSGPLVYAEALSSGKASGKIIKVKDHAKKDKYPFKKRDEEQNSPKTHLKISQHLDPMEKPTSVVMDDFADQKKPSASTNFETLIELDPTEDPNTVIKPPLPTQDGSFIGGINLDPSDKSKEEMDPIIDPLGCNRPGSINTQDELKRDSLFQTVETSQQPASESSPSLPPLDAKPSSDVAQDSLLKDEQKVKLLKRPPNFVTAEKKKKRRKDGSPELAQILGELRSVAINHSHGMERKNLVIIRSAVLRFRSNVYQKSLVLSPPVDPEPNPPLPPLPPPPPPPLQPSEIQTPKLVSSNVEKPKPLLPKPPPFRSDDPTKGGLKRGPSDRQEEIAAKKIKKIEHIKKVTNPNMKTEPKDKGSDSSCLGKPKPKTSAAPTMLIMKFPPRTSLPSAMELRARFARFGTLDVDGTRVFWKSLTCRVVFKYKGDAEAAYRYAVGNASLFGDVWVRYYLRAVDGQGEAGGSSSQASVKLKSCLKKSEPAAKERERNLSPRVKFVLGDGDDNGKGKTLKALEPSNSSTSVGMDFNSKNVVLQRGAPVSSVGQVSKPGLINLKDGSGGSASASASASHRLDISHSMMSLLWQCNDVVANLKAALGYVPYHSL